MLAGFWASAPAESAFGAELEVAPGDRRISTYLSLGAAFLNGTPPAQIGGRQAESDGPLRRTADGSENLSSLTHEWPVSRSAAAPGFGGERQLDRQSPNGD